MIEPIESRYLLAGVTVLMHGYNGNITGWVENAADDIQDRLGGSGASSIYVMTVEKSGSDPAVVSFAPESGQAVFTSTTRGELIIKLDWSDVSGGSFSTGDVGEVISNYFLTKHGSIQPLVELPIHLIGHSRGASLAVAIAKDLGDRGVWVDQLTALDPHPVDGENDFFGVSYGDQKMTMYNNIIFADNYWRTDGNANNFDFDGESVAGAHEGNLNQIVQTNYISSAHMAVTAYYVGTIDTGTSDGGDHPVLSSWYGSSAAKPSRSSTGFVYSRIAGGDRPADGLTSSLGGSALRAATDISGAQWTDVIDLKILSSNSITAGDVVETQFKYADRDSSATVQIYFDTDRNPYNGATLGTSKSFATSALAVGRINAPSGSLDAGNYYVAAKSIDGTGQARWSYSTGTIAVAAANFASLSNGKLVVQGTSGNDKLILSQDGSIITAKRNGATQTFSANLVSSIEVYGNAGNDSVDASAMSRSIYVLGGPGLDLIVGGAGNDTLSGGAHSNTLLGGLGDDVLNGSAGNDSLSGAGGYDRLYSNGGNDTMEGGANVDRFFGSETLAGNELMIGGRGNDKMYAYGGNDTLIGGADSDILNGGDGTDSADNDPNDIRVSIEVLI